MTDQAELFFIEQVIPTWQLARVLGWTSKRTRRAFVRAGIAYRPVGSFEWCVLRSKLVELMPEVEERWREMKERGLLGVPGRARPGNKSRNGTKGDGAAR